MNRPEEVWEHIDCRGENECWPWLKGKTAAGYGAFYCDLGEGRRQYGAHVLVVYLRDGVITKRGTGRVVRHTCDNPICCNPAHLLLGTTAENARDMVLRNRNHQNHARGEGLPFARLTEEQIAAIRREYAPYRNGYRKLARQYGVGKTTIEWVVTGKTWRHVDATA